MGPPNAENRLAAGDSPDSSPQSSPPASPRAEQGEQGERAERAERAERTTVVTFKSDESSKETASTTSTNASGDQANCLQDKHISIEVDQAKRSPRQRLKSKAKSLGGDDAEWRHPIERAGWVSWVTMHWLMPMIRLGARRPLEMSDLPPAPANVRSEVVGERLEAAWRAEVKRSKGQPSFFRALLRCFWREWASAAIFLITFVIATVCSPLIIQGLLRYLNEPEEYAAAPLLGVVRTGGGIIGLLVAALVVGAFSSNTGFLRLSYLGVQIRAAIMYVVFRKSLRLSPTVSSGGGAGEMVNLMSNDSERIFFALLTSHMLWIAPLLIAIVMVLLVNEVGLAGLAGFAVTLLIIPSQIFLGKAMSAQKRRMLRITDTRVGVTAEALSGINVIKMNAWEPQMSTRIQAERQEEMSHGRRVLFLLTINNWLLFSSPTIIALAIFATTALVYGTDDFSIVTVFSVLAFINILRFPLMIIPRAVGALVQALVSFQRMRDYLVLDETEPPPPPPASRNEDVVVDIRGGSFTWAASASRDETPEPVLQDVNLQVHRGELVAVVGKVGSGKSSLLAAMLREIGTLEGEVRLALGKGGSGAKRASSSFPAAEDGATEDGDSGIAYVSQEPWIQNATVRENVLFHSAEGVSSLVKSGASGELAQHLEPVDDRLFRRCIRATELRPDIKILPEGLDTEIGDRGVNLSGGQKSRVAIARALYRTLSHDLELVLLDDCFSALDPVVGQKIFDKLLLDLLRDRTRVVVLNSQMHLLSKFDRIIALEDGRVVLNKPRDEALEDPLLGRIVSLSDKDAALTAAVDDQNAAIESPLAIEPPAERPLSTMSAMSRESTELGPGLGGPELDDEAHGRLYNAENRKRGVLNFGVYRMWLAASVGPGKRMPAFVLLVLLMVGGQVFKVASEYWLSLWSSERLDLPLGLGVFGGLVAAMVLLVLLRGLFFMFIATRSAVNLHNALITNILRAPINLFFDVTPAGRILNRISNDLDKVDQFLPETTFNFLTNILQVVSTLALCSVASPVFLAFLVPVLGLFIYFGRYFSKSSRELKRIESVSRSPLFSNFAETLAGISTIRAFSLQSSLNRKNQHLVDENAKAFLLFWMAARWLALRLDLLILVLQSAVALIAVLLFDQLDPNLIALAIVYSMQLTGMLQFTIRLGVETENAFTSVERLEYYAKSIPQERPARLPASDPPASWPAHGAVEFQGVSMRYRPDLDLVLRDVSFSIAGGEKVGICGRTGAGKSTISATLFRIVDPLDAGRILLDGVDIGTVGLATLREQIGIIPQNPILFSGSLRFNLDPWGKHDDAAILAALERVELGGLAREGLDKALRDGGSNLSVGQRQLISIARTVLQGARLVMADEATANIDSATDALIQQAIRHEFRTQTLLVIAHRLRTIADSDKILVLSFGRVVEFDSPQALLATPGSAYANMLAESSM